MLPRSIRQNFAAFVVARIIYGACQWATLAILAKLGSRSLVGEYAFALAVAAPVVIFSRLHLRAVQATDTADRFRFQDYVQLTLLTSLAALLALLGLSWCLEYDTLRVQLILLIAAVLICESFSELVYGSLQQRERLDIVAVSVIVRSLLALVAGAAGFAISHDLRWFPLGMLVVSLATLVLLDGTIVRRFLKGEPYSSVAKDSPGREELPLATVGRLAQLAWLAFPLGLVMWLILLEANIPRYFIEHHIGTAELGVFAAMLTFAAPGNVVAVGMGNAALPRFAKYFAAGQLAKFRWLLLRMLALAAVVGLAAIAMMAIAGDSLISLLFTSEYTAHRGALLLIMLSGLFQHVSAVAGCAVTAMRKFWLPLWVHLVCLAVVVFGSVLWIEAWGLFGAALALACCSFVAALAFACFGMTAK